MVKPDVAGQGLTTARPDAEQSMRRLDEPTTMRAHSSSKREKAEPLTNFPLKPMKGSLQGPAAEPPRVTRASRRHAGCSSLRPHVRRGKTGAPLSRGAPEALHGLAWNVIQVGAGRVVRRPRVWS